MLIKIVSRPAGENPDWVRDAWIGLTLPTPQSAPRSVRVLDFEHMGGGRLSILGHMLMGRSYRLNGFLVNMKTALDLLAEWRPDAAEWFRANAPHMIDARRYMLFNAEACEPIPGTETVGVPRWPTPAWRRRFPASPGRIALLWALSMLVVGMNGLLFHGRDVSSASAIFYLSAAPVFAALLAGWVLQVRSSILYLVSALVTLNLWQESAALVFNLVTPASWGPNIEGLLTVLYIFLTLGWINGGFLWSRSLGRRTAAVLLAIGVTIGASALPSLDVKLWQLAAKIRPLIGQPDPFDTGQDERPDVDADLLWGEQPKLLDRAGAALRPRVSGRTNIYAMAVAGSGEQDLFSREAKAALAAAARHFGQDDRGGVLLSNGGDDLLRAPLATRSNIAATAKMIGAKADPKQDLLFLYLVSHGSRYAELASGLPNYQPVQAISAESTARALQQAGVVRRVIVVSACYSGSWIPALASDDTIVITAAAKDRTSFGCDDSRELTLFGEAFLSSFAPGNVSLHDAFEAAKRKIATEEAQGRLTPSQPQIFVGRNMQAVWLGKPNGG